MSKALVTVDNNTEKSVAVIEDINSESYSYMNKINTDPMRSLREQAEGLSGISYARATVIDDHNLADKIGDYVMTLLVEAFYKRVKNDPDEWFR